MFNQEQSVDYLSDSVAEQPVQQSMQQPIQHQQPQVNQAIDLNNMHQDNPHWQDYTDRANVAPYSRSYHPPAQIREKSIDVLGEASSNGSSFKTGLLLSSLLLVGSVAGYSLEKQIEKKTPKGYGAIVGSLGAIGIYYVASKTLSSGIWEGTKATGGFLIPMIPIFVSMYQGKKLDRQTAIISAGVGAVASSYVLVTNLMK